MQLAQQCQRDVERRQGWSARIQELFSCTLAACLTDLALVGASAREVQRRNSGLSLLTHGLREVLGSSFLGSGMLRYIGIL
jgi:hypothetical protein